MTFALVKATQFKATQFKASNSEFELMIHILFGEYHLSESIKIIALLIYMKNTVW
ncbi:hypothetical protein ACFFVB_13650 [Formosa undariae]|uniref:Uncharacterized protein n=1 Tax=Formosa undariae TaxID=1325436 RepID=A0ABV5F4R0_9FLAO